MLGKPWKYIARITLYKLLRVWYPFSSVDDLVNAYKEKQPRQTWLLGRITNLLKSRDNFVRGAATDLGKAKLSIEGPINKLCEEPRWIPGLI